MKRWRRTWLAIAATWTIAGLPVYAWGWGHRVAAGAGETAGDARQRVIVKQLARLDAEAEEHSARLEDLNLQLDRERARRQDDLDGFGRGVEVLQQRVSRADRLLAAQIDKIGKVRQELERARLDLAPDPAGAAHPGQRRDSEIEAETSRKEHAATEGGLGELALAALQSDLEATRTCLHEHRKRVANASRERKKARHDRDRLENRAAGREDAAGESAAAVSEGPETLRRETEELDGLIERKRDEREALWRKVREDSRSLVKARPQWSAGQEEGQRLQEQGVARDRRFHEMIESINRKGRAEPAVLSAINDRYAVEKAASERAQADNRRSQADLAASIRLLSDSVSLSAESLAKAWREIEEARQTLVVRQKQRRAAEAEWKKGDGRTRGVAVGEASPVAWPAVGGPAADDEAKWRQVEHVAADVSRRIAECEKLSDELGDAVEAVEKERRMALRQRGAVQRDRDRMLAARDAREQELQQAITDATREAEGWAARMEALRAEREAGGRR